MCNVVGLIYRKYQICVCYFSDSMFLFESDNFIHFVFQTILKKVDFIYFSSHLFINFLCFYVCFKWNIL